MRCVIVGVCTESQYFVVTGALSFKLQTFRGKPNQRIEPIQGTGKLMDRLQDSVATPDMRHFMRQDKPLTLFAPYFRVFRKHNYASKYSGGHRGERSLSSRHDNVSRRREAHLQFGQSLLHAVAYRCCRVSDETAKGHKSEQETAQY